MTWQRATRPEHRDERRQSIINAARRLFDIPPHDPSLRAIASEARIAASGIYRYFSCRESVLLAMLSDELDDWLEHLSQSFTQLPAGATPREIADVTVASVVERGRLIRLLGRRSLLLEHAATVQEVADFRYRALQAGNQGLPSLERLIPGMSPELGRILQLQVLSMVSANWHLRFPSRAAMEAMGFPELVDAKAEFEDVVGWGLELTIRGVRERAREEMKA